MFLKIYIGGLCIYLGKTRLEEKKKASSNEIYISLSMEIKNSAEF